jgi:hypothetical protein
MAVQQTQEALPQAFGLTYMAFLASMPPEVVLGAFTGSIVFLLGVSNKPKWQWMLYFALAFMSGLLGAGMMSSVIAGILGLIHIKVAVPPGMGALISASCVVNILVWVRDNAGRILRERALKGEKA